MQKLRRFALILTGAFLVVATTAGIACAAGVPVEPGNAKPANFEPAGACGCHATLVEQWGKSLHAQALTDPIYVAKLAEATEANPALGGFCKKCHGPAATMTGEIDKKEMSAGVAGGILCSFCHQVVGDTGAIANTSQLVVPDGTRRAQLEEPQAPHKAAYSAFHDTSVICGGCHNVNHPINGMHLESTYAEWKTSPYAEEGVTCQDCHMSREPGVIGPYTGTAAPGVPERDNIYSMTFTGANIELGDESAVRAMLRSAATLELEAPEVLAGGAGDVKVTVTNVGAGHDLPTGLTEVREMWLEVFIEDADGTKTPVGERRFGTILEDDEGNAPVELWEATKIKSDDRIGARESVTETYRLTLPDGVDSATLKAALLYRSTGDDLAKKAGTKNPITEMAAATTRVFSSEEALEAATRADANQGRSRDTIPLVFALAGLAVVGVIVVFVIWKARRARA